MKNEILGIDINETGQLELLDSFSNFYNELPFGPQRVENLRYYYENDWYSYCDAIFLYSMIRHLKPKKIIEIGSGFSSAVMLDTNQKFFNSEINLEFIEPSPGRLFGLMTQIDRLKCKVHTSNVESMSLEVFDSLESGDILFVDSSHVFRPKNDLDFIFFKILPRLKKGVHIHFHDIFYPFEYSEAAVKAGIIWNEVYFLRSFLMYNDHFKINIFSDFLSKEHRDRLGKMDLCLKNTGGNIWIEKTK